MPADWKRNATADTTADETFPEYEWEVGNGAAANYRELGKVLASGEDLFRRPEYGAGLWFLRPNREHVAIATGAS